VEATGPEPNGAAEIPAPGDYLIVESIVLWGERLFFANLCSVDAVFADSFSCGSINVCHYGEYSVERTHSGFRGKSPEFANHYEFGKNDFRAD
jgi:hypothetical protein